MVSEILTVTVCPSIVTWVVSGSHPCVCSTWRAISCVRGGRERVLHRGLCGGSGVNACDTDALIGFLTTNSAEGLAFAEIQGIDQADIPNFINGLTEGSLLLPVTATNHNFSDGKANPISDTTLDAGTAVLLGSDGCTPGTVQVRESAHPECKRQRG